MIPTPTAGPLMAAMIDLVIAGGAESMSGTEFYSTDMRWGTKRPSVEFHDRLAKPRTNSGGVNFPVEGGMIDRGARRGCTARACRLFAHRRRH